MNLLQTIQTSTDANTYVINGCIASGGTSIALSLSSNTIRIYDARSTSFLVELRDHTQTITDVIATPAAPQLVFSSQEDGGVMISDLRQGRPAHFITDACGSGITCSSIGISPSVSSLIVGKSTDLHVYDARTWRVSHQVEQMHWDEITRVRYLDEHIICSAGEDLMINCIDTAPTTQEDDLLLQGISCGEVVTRMTVMQEIEKVMMVGSCENGYVMSYNPDTPERRVERPNFSTYLVDWCVVNGQVCLVTGEKDDEGNAGPLSVVLWGGGDHLREALPSQLQPNQSIVLPHVHKDIGRVALGFGDRLVTGGEDGLLAFWSPAVGGGVHNHSACNSTTISSSVRGGEKEHVPIPSLSINNNNSNSNSRHHHGQVSRIPGSHPTGQQDRKRKGKPY